LARSTHFFALPNSNRSVFSSNFREYGFFGSFHVEFPRPFISAGAFSNPQYSSTTVTVHL